MNIMSAKNVKSAKATKTVFTQGAFDLFHYGHVRFLEKCKTLGDELVVAVNSDKLYRDYKEKEPIIPWKYRKDTLMALKCVDAVVKIDKFSPVYFLKLYKPDIYVICKEWESTKVEEIRYMKSIGKKVIVMPYLKTVSSTEIKKQIAENYIKHNVQLCPGCHKKL